MNYRSICLGTKARIFMRILFKFIPPLFHLRHIVRYAFLNILLGRNTYGVIEGYKIRINDIGIFLVFLANTWEPHVLAHFRNSIKSGMTVLDIGARRGLYSIVAAELVGTSGSVIAFEPVPLYCTELIMSI